jgi:hypothetical protein
MYQKRAAILGLVIMASVGSPKASASDCDDLIARHMIGEAMLAAQFVALAENGGMAPSEINAALKNISENSAFRNSGSPTQPGTRTLQTPALILRLAPTPRINPKRHHFGLCSMVGRKS